MILGGFGTGTNYPSMCVLGQVTKCYSNLEEKNKMILNMNEPKDSIYFNRLQKGKGIKLIEKEGKEDETR